MKARFSLIALTAAGLILQGCGHEGPDSSNRGGPQLAKQTDSSNRGGTQGATPTPAGKASQAPSGQQDANRVLANQPAPVPTKAQKESTRAVQAQTLPHYLPGVKSGTVPHKLHHTSPTPRSDDAESQAVIVVNRKAGQTERFAESASTAEPATVAENTIPSSTSTSSSAAAATPSRSTETTASATPPSSSVSTAGSGSATGANDASASPIGSTPTGTTASAASSASARSNPASNGQQDAVRARVNELDELTAKNSRMIADVDARATESIRNAMSKANDAEAHAVDAGNRANQAQQAVQTAQTAHTRITGVEQTVSKLDQYQPVTQAEIRFRRGQTALTKNAKEALDQMAITLKGQRGYIVEVQGFSPGASTTGVENSREMAQMVIRYLVLNHEIPVYRIYTVGMGNAPIQAAGKKVRTDGGRVAVTLLRNNLDDMGSSAAGNISGSTGQASGAVTSGAPASNQTEQPAAPASQPSNTGVTPGKPSSSSKPPQP